MNFFMYILVVFESSNVFINRNRKKNRNNNLLKNRLRL